MFLLHDHARRALCRFGFLGLCLAPTVTVLAWGVRHHLPSHVAAACREASLWTDCPAEIAQVTHPRPGVTVLHNLTLQDAATGEAIVRAERLTIDDRGGTLRIAATRPWIAVAGLPRLWQALSGEIDGWRGDQTVELFAGTLDLESAAAAFAFQDVQTRLHASAEGPQFDAQFRQSGTEGVEPAEIHIVRDVQSHWLRYDLATGPTAFPCGLAAALVPEFESLGLRATLQGRMSVVTTPDGWNASLVGPASIAGFDLEAVARTYCGRRLTGPARLELRLLNLGNGSVAAADGELRAGPGGIDAALIYSFGDALGIVHNLPNDRSAFQNTYGLYDKLAVGFSVGPEGVLLRGKCAGADGCMLTVDRGQPFAQQPSGRFSIDALVRALTPLSAGYVPATRQAERLLSRLPLSGEAGPANAARLGTGISR